MKKIVTMAAIAVMSLNVVAQSKTYQVDDAKSKINWTGKKVTGQHTGTLKLKSGNVVFENELIKSVEINIDMTSMICTDITDEKTNANFIGHLKSEDFFSVEKFPTATFKSTKFEKLNTTKQGAPNYKVTGSLTIKGISNEISFDAYINAKESSLVSNANVVFDRSKWDIRYGSGSFFDDLGDKVIYDDIEMTFYINANTK
jgi:polyisoprenoid-binding protein YceI